MKNLDTQLTKLTHEELNIILPRLVEGLKRKSDPEHPIKGAKLVQFFNDKKDILGLESNFSEPRLRKVINFIRANGIAPIIATSRGYYYSNDPEEIMALIISLQSRITSLEAAIQGLRNILAQLPPPIQKAVKTKIIDALGFEW